MTTSPASQTASLPAAVRDFVAAHVVRDPDTAVIFLSDDVVVTDQGRTVHGRDAALALLREASTAFDYTTEQIGVRQVDDMRWVVTLRLEGTFPGGVAELDHRFTLRGDSVAELVIADAEG
ncbi:nuclear transport factor 2 family protein [Aquipuribacter sp. SD81]|uniref:nuclear transport factor 2 family protein n=1 Tax=Aquipuribacter sp. SD81 TaxID=3127703 RepID=UPI00301711A0